MIGLNPSMDLIRLGGVTLALSRTLGNPEAPFGKARESQHYTERCKYEACIAPDVFNVY